MEGRSWWVISSMPELPPRQHEHERRYTAFTQPFILTRGLWEIWGWPNDIRGPCRPKVSRHLSHRWGKIPKKTSSRTLILTGDRTRACYVTSAHATACITAMDANCVSYRKLIMCIRYSFRFNCSLCIPKAWTQYRRWKNYVNHSVQIIIFVCT